MAGWLESVACTVSVEEPAVVGVPVSLQSLFRLNPAGTVPATRVQVYGAVPPATPIVPL